MRYEAPKWKIQTKIQALETGGVPAGAFFSVEKRSGGHIKYVFRGQGLTK